MIFDNQVLVSDSPTCARYSHSPCELCTRHKQYAKTGPQLIFNIKASKPFKPSISSLMSAPIGSKILDTPFHFSLPSLPSLPLSRCGTDIIPFNNKTAAVPE